MKLGYYGRASLLLSAAAECTLLRVQGDTKPRHLLVKPTNTDPTGVHQLLAQYLLSRTQPILLTQEECIWHLLIIWYVRLGSVPTASLQLLRRRGINPLTSAIFPVQGCISAGRLSSESAPPPASLWYLRNLPVSHLDPDVLVSGIENFLDGHLKLTSLSYAKLKTKFISHLSLHVCHRGRFLCVNENEAWPNGCLSRSFMLGVGLSKYSPLNAPTDLQSANRLFNHVLVILHQKQYFPSVL
jgi:hypothetical protein